MTSKTSLLQKPFLDPADTLILVTGASGHIASNIIKEALDLGYHVRGTARTQEKCSATIREHDNNPNYTTAIVSDFSHPSSQIDDAVRGVDSIIHVASDTTFSEDADHVIGSVVAGTLNFLRAAAAEPRVKRFTLTSSYVAALLPRPGVEGVVVTSDSWADEAVDAARNAKGQAVGPNPYPYVVYGASKVEGEKALWRFAEEEKPSFVVNAVLPSFNSGRIVGSVGPTGVFAIRALREGSAAIKSGLVAQYYIDVVDDARLHLAAAVLDESVKSQRIFAFAAPVNINDLVEAIRKVRPDADHSKLQLYPDEPSDLSKVPNEPAADLLRKWYGQDGFKSLEQSIRENLEGV